MRVYINDDFEVSHTDKIKAVFCNNEHIQIIGTSIPIQHRLMQNEAIVEAHHKDTQLLALAQKRKISEVNLQLEVEQAKDTNREKQEIVVDQAQDKKTNSKIEESKEEVEIQKESSQQESEDDQSEQDLKDEEEEGNQVDEFHAASHEEMAIDQAKIGQIDKNNDINDDMFKTPAKTGCGISEMVVEGSPDKIDRDLDINTALEQCRKISFGPEQNNFEKNVEVTSNKNSKELDGNTSTENKKDKKPSSEKEKLKELLGKKKHKSENKQKNQNDVQEKRKTKNSKEVEKDATTLTKSQKRKQKKMKNKNREKAESIDKAPQEYVPDNSWSEALHK